MGCSGAVNRCGESRGEVTSEGEQRLDVIGRGRTEGGT